MTLGGDIDDLKALGHGALSLFSAGIMLAVVAVLLSPRSNTATILNQAFALLSWLVGQVVNPLTGGASVALTNQLLPAEGYGMTFANGTASTAIVPTGTSTSTGTGTADNVPATTTSTGLPGTVQALPPGWSSTYRPGDIVEGTTLADGTTVIGYHPIGSP